MVASYALMQHSLADLDVDAVSHAFDEVPWLARADAHMLVKRASGVLVDNLSKAEAEALARALAARGAAVEVVEQAWLELPRMVSCRRADVEPEGLSIYDLYGRPTRVPWSRVLLLAAGSYLVSERVVRPRSALDHVMSPARSWHTGGVHTSLDELSVPGEVEYTDQERVILEVIVDLPARYRIEPQRFDYSYLGARRESSAGANFPLLVKDLLERAPHAIQNRGLRGLASQDREVMRYPGLPQYERELAWSLWRYLGPGTRLDAGAPYRSRGPGAPRLAVPLSQLAATRTPARTEQPATRAAAPSRSLIPARRPDALAHRRLMGDWGMSLCYGFMAATVLAVWSGSGAPFLIIPPLALALRYLQRRRRRRLLVRLSDNGTPSARARAMPSNPTEHDTE